MKANGQALSRRQESFVSALLTTPTIVEAAQVSGIAEATAWRWMQLDAFQAAYREARRAVVQQAMTQLQQATGEAVEVMRAIMRDLEAPPAARLMAAKAILETAIKAVEVESLEVRIAALETVHRRNGV